MSGRARSWFGRIRRRLHNAFAEDHTPREIAGSFALGTFIAVLPTGGTALIIFLLIAYLVDRISKLALLASLVVFNPLVKWSLYAVSFWLGQLLLGPVPGLEGSTIGDVSFSAGPEIVIRQLLGNLVVALVLAAVGYAIVLRLARAFERRDIDPVEVVSETVTD